MIGVLLAAAASLRVENLRVEYLTNPLGLDAARPRFSWQLASSLRGVEQASYRLIVANAASKQIVWDSKVVASNSSVNVEYAGSTLGSGEVYT